VARSIHEGSVLVQEWSDRLTHVVQADATSEAALRSRYGVTVVGGKSPGQDFTYAHADTRVGAADLLIVPGATRLVEKFAAETGG
jgi:Trk K+ transport system NAD-binding subunit